VSQFVSNVSTRKKAIGVLAALLMCCCLIQQEEAFAGENENPMDILIVANKSVPVNSINEAVLRGIFLKVRKDWPGGQAAMPVNAKDETLRAAFRSKVLQMDASAENRHWEEVKVKYGQSEPPALSNNLKAVFSLKGSVSYVYRKDFAEGIAKVVMVIPAF